MNMILKTTSSIWLIILFSATSLWAQDMRQLQIQAREAREALIRKAEAEKNEAEKADAESRALILNDRTSLEKAIAEIRASNRRLETEVNTLDNQHRQLSEEEQQMNLQLAETGSMIRELVGVIRINAKDIDALISQNLQRAVGRSPSAAFLELLAGQARFPGMDDIRRMVRALVDQITSSAEVVFRRGTIVDRAGNEIEADVLLCGPFTAAYRLADEVGFCNFSASGGRLYALSRLPSGRMQKQLADYMDGRREGVPMDISRGGALRQLTHELKLWEQVPKGGPIVWPILIILAAGLLIVAERVVFLARKHLDADGLTRIIEGLSLKNKWEEGIRECDQRLTKPVARIIKAGLQCCHMQREEMENALQEAILKEIPPMERFLSTLGMLAAIAPLLGLLGTVTGMIDTFHVITLHGTGDPRLMSGGISEALVTTMLGLSVAIPLMLCQTLLNRAVDKRIGEMEEKAVTLVNIVHKYREAA
jgi:biopolymer transport protein ExbB